MSMAEKFKVKEEGKLLAFLFSTLSGWSKKRVKERLKSATVAINGTVTTKFDAPLVVGDMVEVGVMQKRSTPTVKKLEIIYQGRAIIAINKPAGLLSVGNNQENKEHALAMLRSQLSVGRDALKIWPVNRLDRDTSGILLFATSKEMREAVMANWDKAEKIYLAIVEGQPKEANGTINQPLRLDEKIYRMHVGQHPDAKFAITHYALKESSSTRSLLEVKIETGRQHQIRAHLSWLGNSIVGDERYGKKGDRMGLHATKLTIIHPMSQRSLSFEAEAPKDFYGLLNESSKKIG